MATFDASTARVMTSTGWTVGATVATHDYGQGVEAKVWTDSRWTVTARGAEIAKGQDKHPALAACDANEAAWAERDRRRAA